MSAPGLKPLGRMLLLLGLVAGSSLAVGESSAASTAPQAGPPTGAQLGKPHFGPLAGDVKRAYSYRSEFKRLPLYQFGLGKRLVQSMAGDKRGQPFTFGLGKRTKHYAFGLGKRSSSSSSRGSRSYDEAEPLRLGSPALHGRLADVYAQKLLENYLESKRASAGGFNFGLGKRDSELGSLLRDYELQERLPAKHSRDSQRYQFGLGKRDGSGNRSLEALMSADYDASYQEPEPDDGDEEEEEEEVEDAGGDEARAQQLLY